MNKLIRPVYKPGDIVKIKRGFWDRLKYYLTFFWYKRAPYSSVKKMDNNGYPIMEKFNLIDQWLLRRAKNGKRI